MLNGCRFNETLLIWVIRDVAAANDFASGGDETLFYKERIIKRTKLQTILPVEAMKRRLPGSDVLSSMSLGSGPRNPGIQ